MSRVRLCPSLPAPHAAGAHAEKAGKPPPRQPRSLPEPLQTIRKVRREPGKAPHDRRTAACGSHRYSASRLCSAASGAITLNPPGTDNANRMIGHTSPPVGMVPVRHSVTRSSSTPRRSANSSHDRPASWVSRSSLCGKSSGQGAGRKSSLRFPAVHSPTSSFCRRL